MIDDPILTEIQQAYSERRLIPFIGSGFSKPLELPDWRELVSELAKKAGFEPELFFLHGNYAQLLEYIKDTHPYEWTDFIYNIRLKFDSPDAVQKRQTSATHNALGDLTDIRTIYTTNYDTHIESLLIEKGRKVIVYADLADFVRPFDVDMECEVIKFHGTLKEEKTIILTETQYFDRMSLEEPVDQRLRSDLLSNSFLFMGYSFSDPNIRYIWYKINKLKQLQTKDYKIKLKPSFFVTFGNEPVQAKLLEKWDIKIVTLDPLEPTTSLAAFLDQIKYSV